MHTHIQTTPNIPTPSYISQVVMAFDDVSVPLPPMRSPDIRAIIMEEAEVLCIQAGITDIKFICSVALHRFIRWGGGWGGGWGGVCRWEGRCVWEGMDVCVCRKHCAHTTPCTVPTPVHCTTHALYHPMHCTTPCTVPPHAQQA